MKSLVMGIIGLFSALRRNRESKLSLFLSFIRVVMILIYQSYYRLKSKQHWENPVLVEDGNSGTADAAGGVIEVKRDSIVGFLQLIGINCFCQVFGCKGISIEVKPLIT